MPSIASLPFVGPRQNPRKDQLPRDFWHNVTSTGDAIKDQELGTRYARLTLQVMQTNDFSPLLGWVARDMIENGCPKHIVAGFFHVIAGACLGNEIPATSGRLEGPVTVARAKTKPNANLRLVK
jgi:hypothetical protein